MMIPKRLSQRFADAIIGSMDERELTHWLDALAEQGLIRAWQWGLEVEPGRPADVCYMIDGRTYTHAGAVKLVRDFEVAYVRC
jgi:hypothetical protein